MHTLFSTELPSDAISFVIEGDEARHALKVKRLTVGDHLRVLDGRGTVALTRVTDTKGRLALAIERRDVAPRVRPALHLYTATPKGPRVEELIDGLVQVGAASWTPMQTKLGVVDPRESKLSRLDRIAVEAAKQAQRPWLMTMGDKATFTDALRAPAGVALVLADASGGGYTPSGSEDIRILIGPEGGFMPEEIDRARSAGAQVVSIGPHVLRIESAGPVATALVYAAEATARIKS